LATHSIRSDGLEQLATILNGLNTLAVAGMAYLYYDRGDHWPDLLMGILFLCLSIGVFAGWGIQIWQSWRRKQDVVPLRRGVSEHFSQIMADYIERLPFELSESERLQAENSLRRMERTLLGESHGEAPLL
jgi:hypothetical protein